MKPTRGIKNIKAPKNQKTAKTKRAKCRTCTDSLSRKQNKIRQASGHWRVQIPLYLFPHALLFLSWFFFLSAVPFFLLTRACTWGRPLGAAAPESPPLELQPLSPRFPFGRILAQLFDFLNLQRGTKKNMMFWHRSKRPKITESMAKGRLRSDILKDFSSFWEPF